MTNIDPYPGCIFASAIFYSPLNVEIFGKGVPPTYLHVPTEFGTICTYGFWNRFFFKRPLFLYMTNTDPDRRCIFGLGYFLFTIKYQNNRIGGAPIRKIKILFQKP